MVTGWFSSVSAMSLTATGAVFTGGELTPSSGTMGAAVLNT